jgi:hypothetical protein
MRASPKKRVAAVGSIVGVLLLAGVLVAAPASAATGFTFGPASGEVGDTITLTATGGAFVSISSVTFNGVSAAPSATSGAAITANVPASATDGPIRIVDSGTTLTSATSFDVILATSVTAVSPVCDITGGGSVTFTGPDMASVSAISFGGTAQPVFTPSATSVIADVPAGAPAGTLTVTITNAAGPGTTQLFNGACSQTITSFSPTSGPVGTTVLITGTNFPASGACDVYFGATKATTGLVNGTGTQITTVVPVGAVTGQVRAFCGATGAAAASTNFTVTAVPSITSFTPTSGTVGTVVTITGANFTGATAVKFNNVAATTFTVNSATQITATVPVGATTGKISVTTSAGTGTSTTDFTVIGGAEHDRRVTLDLSKHINAEGKVKVPDGTNACKSGQKVKIQKLKKDGSWKTIETDKTNNNGAYSDHLPDNNGKYRARVGKVTLANGDVCLADTSPKVKHSDK